MIKRITKTTSLILAALMIFASLSLFGCSSYYGHTVFDYNQVTYSRPDITAVTTAMDNADAEIATCDSAMAVSISVTSVVTSLNRYIYKYTIANIEYRKNPSEWTSEIAWLSNNYSELYSRYCKIMYDALHCRYGDELFAGWSEEDVQQIERQYNFSKPAFVTVNSRINELQREYTALTEPAANSSEAEFITYANSAAEILIELADSKNALAKLADYSDYRKYAYEIDYDRDYKTNNITVLRNNVKEYFSPLFTTEQAEENKINSIALSFLGAANPAAASLAYEKYFAEVGDKMVKAYEYMNKCNLFYRTDSTNTTNAYTGAYTTYLYEYSTPFMYVYEYNNYRDVNTFIHEFGHFTAEFIDEDNVILSEDIAEIQSQSNELLFFKYMPQIFGEDNATKIKSNLISSTAVDSIALGCILDEFQEKIYLNTDDYRSSPESLTTLFESLCNDYGVLDYLQTISSYGTNFKYWWALVPHTFNQPFYYISYAVSALPSLSLYQKSLTDRAGAIKSYNVLLNDAPDAESFFDLLDRAEIDNPFTTSTISSLATFIGENI